MNNRLIVIDCPVHQWEGNASGVSGLLLEVLRCLERTSVQGMPRSSVSASFFEEA